MPILKRLREESLKMKEIWETSALQMGGRDTNIQQMIWFEEDVQKELDKGNANLDSAVIPETEQNSPP